MSLLGTGFLLTVCAVSLVCLAAVWVGWARWPGRLAVPGRAVSLLLVMALGAALSGAQVNRQFGFYATWSDLLASSARSYEPPHSFTSAAADPSLQILTPDWEKVGAAAAKAARGTLLRVVFTGSASGISRPGLLYLPADYFTGVAASSLPVIEMFHGAPGGPTNFDTNLKIADVLDTEINAHRLPAVIAAFPTSYVGRPGECVDAVGGERNETYLAVEVPADIDETFRRTPGRSFAALGFSEGGFCAVNLGLHHPDRFSAVASLSGYFTAGTDTGTGANSPYRGSRSAIAENSPLWWVQHRSPTGPALYLTAGADDPYAVAQAAGLRAAARTAARRLPVTVTTLPASGHNFRTWSQSLPAALDFLGAHLPVALAPALELPAAAEPTGPGPSPRR